MQHFPDGFDLKLALKLAQLCEASYKQRKAHEHGKPWKKPRGYTIAAVMEGVYENVSLPIGFVAENKKQIVVAWRGTATLEEWIEDVKFDQVPCTFVSEKAKASLGDMELYTTGRSDNHPSPQSVVMDYLKTADTRKTLYVTGHSLGGALAVLNTADIATNSPFKNPVMYTFAGPRVGDPVFASAFNQRVKDSWRVVNTHDEVPKLPPKACPPIFHEYHFAHVNHRVPITFGSWWNLPADHIIKNYIKCLKKLVAG